MNDAARPHRSSWILAVLAAMLACDAENGGGPGELPTDPGGKADTAYLSDAAVELEGEYRGTARLTYPGYSPGELQAQADGLHDGSIDPGETLIEQVKFAKNRFNADLLHVNLADDDTEVLDAYVEGDEVVIEYRMIADALVSPPDLEAAGVVLDDLIGQTFEAEVPADPREPADRFGTTCTKGIASVNLENWNYFYFFHPDKSGCNIDLETVTVELTKVNDQSGVVYPEYDRLVEDGKIDAVVFFVAESHDEIPDKDWGVREWKDFERRLDYAGFSSAEQGAAKRWTRYSAGLEETIDVYSPYAMHEDPDTILRSELKTKEIFLYAGHSFYGSLDALDDRENYDEGAYQIIYMNSCWTYEYYTKKVFQNKARADDPHGWLDADVVNNSEVGWFHNYEDVTTILLMNLIKGAESGGRANSRTFDWGSIIEQMNAEAITAWKRHKTKTHEIFGVSGVRTNEFQPG